MVAYYIGLHYKLSVARRALPRQLLVARHIKVVVPGAREDDLASLDLRAGIVLLTAAAHCEDGFRLSVIKTPKSFPLLVVDNLDLKQNLVEHHFLLLPIAIELHLWPLFSFAHLESLLSIRKYLCW